MTDFREFVASIPTLRGSLRIVSAAALVYLSTCSVCYGQASVPESLEPNPLSPKAETALVEIASQTDVLILGELHGTREVPALASALLAPLTDKGYGVLALEVPVDQQEQLAAWATGKSEVVPKFFAEPSADGRSGVQVLSLVRRAMSPPFSWKLICFDETWEISISE